MFDNIYDKMSEDFGSLELAMGMVYNNILANPEDESQRALLETLGSVAANMLGTQSDFVDIYADEAVKAQLQSRLESKKSTLKNEIQEIIRTNERTL